MQSGAQTLLNHIVYRIQSAIDETDSAAKPLNVRYAQEKRVGRYVAQSGHTKYSGMPVRDWTLRGWTIRSLKVKLVSEDRAQIGPITRQAYIIMASRNKFDHMWGLSPTDQEAFYTQMREELKRKPPLQITRAA